MFNNNPFDLVRIVLLLLCVGAVAWIVRALMAQYAAAKRAEAEGEPEPPRRTFGGCTDPADPENEIGAWRNGVRQKPDSVLAREKAEAAARQALEDERAAEH